MKSQNKLLFGITGGIGCGKSLVAQFLKEKGVPIIQADPLAKELAQKLPEIRQALIREFGKDVYTSVGTLNKSRLNELVFENPQTRIRVNQIIHPPVMRHIAKLAKKLFMEGNLLVGVEAALIYEAQMDQRLDLVVVVAAPLEKRLQWLKQRDGLSEEEILKRINSQIPLEEKIRRSDYAIENNGSIKELKQKVEKFYKWLQQQTDATVL